VIDRNEPRWRIPATGSIISKGKESKETRDPAGKFPRSSLAFRGIASIYTHNAAAETALVVDYLHFYDKKYLYSIRSNIIGALLGMGGGSVDYSRSGGVQAGSLSLTISVSTEIEKQLAQEVQIAVDHELAQIDPHGRLTERELIAPARQAGGGLGSRWRDHT
jgi:hypothetical protein